MKFKPNDKSGGVAIELGPTERQLPAQSTEQSAATLPIFNLKKILVPVDFSDCSNKALVYATALAKQFEAELTLMHVVEIYPGPPELILPEPNLYASQCGRKNLEVLRLAVGHAAPCEVLLRTGVPHSEITLAAKELESDLIILSTHGHTGVARVILGSTAERVVRHAPCPVLVVREKEHEFLKPPVTHKN
jgi:nucleotide-binding universal stress UspA family protein